MQALQRLGVAGEVGDFLGNPEEEVAVEETFLLQWQGVAEAEEAGCR